MDILNNIRVIIIVILVILANILWYIINRINYEYGYKSKRHVSNTDPFDFVKVIMFCFRRNWNFPPDLLV